ncbi:hypothetical protein T265_05032 [Opisthorchis viverrini]|uniref:Uncharacterized protein n=1 Tax=Opisthorchis viverrini TaxID=6198 RepID=A0A074ZXH6_OPIVI|nr:hypothetical protein T265_05032 [Opisthorchis viverrini]KER28050.1 hypothetical protein T265_05032 [Opisthorchis viverrini]
MVQNSEYFLTNGNVNRHLPCDANTIKQDVEVPRVLGANLQNAYWITQTTSDRCIQHVLRKIPIFKAIWFSREATESLVYGILQMNVLHTDRLMFQLARYSRYRRVAGNSSEGASRRLKSLSQESLKHKRVP